MMYPMRLFLVSALAVFSVIALSGQPPAGERGGRGGRGGGPPKNLKVLPADVNIRQVMGGFTAGLGVMCTYCHVQGQFDSDENPKKDVARSMIKMVQQINMNFPDGKQHVTCFTCHRGAEMPLTAPPAAQ